jgi:hypothetical protein
MARRYSMNTIAISAINRDAIRITEDKKKKKKKRVKRDFSRNRSTGCVYLCVYIGG